jgi:hypothetical protein
MFDISIPKSGIAAVVVATEAPNNGASRMRTGIEKLARLTFRLDSGDSSVTDVCAEVRFESLGSFSALFRRRFGAPPSHLRRSL